MNGDFAVDTWGEVLVVISIIGALLAGLDWRIRQAVSAHVDAVVEDLKADITKMTQPIQPNYRNGGQSLADLAHEVRRISKAIGVDE